MSVLDRPFNCSNILADFTNVSKLIVNHNVMGAIGKEENNNNN